MAIAIILSTIAINGQYFLIANDFIVRFNDEPEIARQFIEDNNQLVTTSIYYFYDYDEQRTFHFSIIEN